MPDDRKQEINTFPGGYQAKLVIGKDDSRTTNLPDGSTTNLTKKPDPRWGMNSPVPNNLTSTTPGNLTSSVITTRTVTLVDPANPMSLATQTDTVNINSRIYTSTYTAATRTYSNTTPAGRTSSSQIDTQGRVTQEQVTSLETANYIYDNRGRLTSVTSGTGGQTRTTTFTYNLSGYLDTITDPLNRVVKFEYDGAGRVTKQTLPDNQVILYAYDANGNLTSLTPPSHPAHTFTYNSVNLPVSYAPPNVGAGTNQTLYSYNLDQQPTRFARPDGKNIDFGYDNVGRLSTLAFSAGTFNYSYSPTTDNLTGITAPGGINLGYSYDGSLLMGESWSGVISGTVSRVYDNNLRVVSTTINGANPVNYQYDNDSLLTGAGSLSLSRNPQNGLLTGSTLGVISDTLTYNSFGELSNYSAFNISTSAYATQFTHDKLGRITQKVETVGGVTNTYDYGYDLEGRLIQVKKNNVVISSYSYDGNGNRLSYTGSGGSVSATYDNQDRLLQYGPTSYSYSANGELQNKTNAGQTTNYQYDELGNLRKVILPNTTQLDYLIDGQNRRVGKQVNGTLVQGFLYQDDLRPIAELDGAGNLVSRFVYGSRSNVPDFMIKAGVTYRLISDHLGSVRFVVNTVNGSIVQQLDYDEFGNVLADTNSGFQPLASEVVFTTRIPNSPVSVQETMMPKPDAGPPKTPLGSMVGILIYLDMFLMNL